MPWCTFRQVSGNGKGWTYYLPEAPSAVMVLNVQLNNHEAALANRIAGTYEVKFIKACFAALQTRTQFNVDTFFTNNNIDLNVDNTLLTQSKLCASLLKHKVAPQLIVTDESV